MVCSHCIIAPRHHPGTRSASEALDFSPGLGSQEIQQLPYQHIVKWLPSKMRSRDPGPDDCLDIQVETASGKKDLRMRCQSEPAVQDIIADIRQTVQVRSLQCCFTLLWLPLHMMAEWLSAIRHCCTCSTQAIAAALAGALPAVLLTAWVLLHGAVHSYVRHSIHRQGLCIYRTASAIRTNAALNNAVA
jgi:hypothetical protein